MLLSFITNHFHNYRDNCSWLEFVEKVIIPFLLVLFAYVLNNLRKSIEKDRILQNEQFANGKRMVIYDKIANKVIKTNTCISQSIVLYQGVIAILVSMVDAKELLSEGQKHNRKHIEAVFSQMENTWKELSCHVENLINTYKTYKILFYNNIAVLDKIIKKLQEVNQFYLCHYADLLTLKTAYVNCHKLNDHDKKVLLNLFSVVSLDYKKNAEELIQLINEFCDSAQVNLLGEIIKGQLINTPKL